MYKMYLSEYNIGIHSYDFRVMLIYIFTETINIFVIVIQFYICFENELHCIYNNFVLKMNFS